MKFHGKGKINCVGEKDESRIRQKGELKFIY